MGSFQGRPALRAGSHRGGLRLGLALAGLLAGVAAVAPAPSVAQEFQVDRQAQNLVRFISRAAIEEFDGTTSKIDGYVLLGPDGLSAQTRGEGTEVYVEVDLASLDTGIGLRNRHMRDNYLEVAKYPFATLRGVIESSTQVRDGGFRVAVRGTFTVHGVSKPRVLTCRVDPRGGGYRAQCSFEVLLSDHNIEIPRVMFLKLADEVRLELDFVVSRAGSPNGGVR